MVTSCELLRKGGEWLGAARCWIQRRCINGEHVTWSSVDALQKTFTVKDVEEIAAIAVAAYINADREAAQGQEIAAAAFKLACQVGWKPGAGDKSGEALIPFAVEEIRALRKKQEELMSFVASVNNIALNQTVSREELAILRTQAAKLLEVPCEA